MIYFTSDTHFDHANINRTCNRGFSDVAEMNKTLIENINKVVQPADFLYHLGDFAWWGDKLNYWQNLLSFREQINCRNIYWLLGNHDHYQYRVDINKYFIDVNNYVELKINKQFYVLCHYPIHSWNKMRYGSIMLHGHQHLKPEQNQLEIRRYDVGVDANNFHPISLDQINHLMKERKCFLEN